MSSVPKTLTDTQISAISRLFSSAILKELAVKGRSHTFARLVAELDWPNPSLVSSLRVEEFFDTAFMYLQKTCYRHEYVYKAAVAHKILLGTHSLRTASMLTEFRAGECKADVVILNGTSTVYEVKSERDKLDRLSKQIAEYEKVFAKINVIAGKNHLDILMGMVPQYVGILVLNSEMGISTFREAQDISQRTDPETVLNSLQVHEAQLLLERLGIDIPSVPNTLMRRELAKCFKKLAPVDVQKAMVEVLKKTRSLKHLSELLSELPASLKAAALWTPIKSRDHTRLVSALRTPLLDALKWSH